MNLEEYRKRIAGKAKGKGKRPYKRRSPFTGKREPNETEAAYNREVLKGLGKYEAVSLRLPGGSRYTPDWVVFDAQGRMECHEVKGAYKFASENRAVTAVRECVCHFPAVTFIWATRERNGKWTIHKTGGQQ